MDKLLVLVPQLAILHDRTAVLNKFTCIILFPPLCFKVDDSPAGARLNDTHWLPAP